jgi:hypothetical protein
VGRSGRRCRRRGGRKLDDMGRRRRGCELPRGTVNGKFRWVVFSALVGFSGTNMGIPGAIYHQNLNGHVLARVVTGGLDPHGGCTKSFRVELE